LQDIGNASVCDTKYGTIDTVWRLFVPGQFVPLSYKVLGIEKLNQKYFLNPASI